MRAHARPPNHEKVPSLSALLEAHGNSDAEQLAPTDERVPGRQWSEWRIVERTSVGENDYVLLRRVRMPMSEFDKLTAREYEALRHASTGISNKEIAYRMGVMPPTVSVLLGRATRRLGACDRGELVRRFLAREPPRAGRSG